MRTVISMTVLVASLCLISQPVFAKHERGQRQQHEHEAQTGGSSAEHMSSEGAENSNGAGMADRDKGQARADDRAAESADQADKQGRKGEKQGRGKKR